MELGGDDSGSIFEQPGLDPEAQGEGLDMSQESSDREIPFDDELGIDPATRSENGIGIEGYALLVDGELYFMPGKPGQESGYDSADVEINFTDEEMPAPPEPDDNPVGEALRGVIRAHEVVYESTYETVRRGVDDPELQEALAAAGLAIKQTEEGNFDTFIRDPAQFTSAVAGIEPGTVSAEKVQTNAVDLVDRAMRTASSIIYTADFPTVFQPFRGGHTFRLDIDPDYVQGRLPIGETEYEYVQALAANASSLAVELQRIGAPDSTVEALHALAVAEQDDAIVDWTRAYVAKLIGHGHQEIGAQRYNGMYAPGEYWDRTARPVLRAMQERAPGGVFTALVHETARNDVQQAITALTEAIRDDLDPAADPGEGPLWYGQREYVFARDMYDMRMPSLRRGLEVLDEIFSSPDRPEARP